MRIKEIKILYNVYFNNGAGKKEFKDFIIIETSKDLFVCDTKNGICYKNNDEYKNIVSKNKNRAWNLYVDTGEYQSDIEIGDITYIKYYKKARLINSYNSDTDILYENYVEFGDKNGNHFFIRPIDNEIYTRDNYKIISSKNEIDLFKKDTKIETNIKLFIYLKFFEVIDYF